MIISDTMIFWAGLLLAAAALIAGVAVLCMYIAKMRSLRKTLDSEYGAPENVTKQAKEGTVNE